MLNETKKKKGALEKENKKRGKKKVMTESGQNKNKCFYYVWEIKKNFFFLFFLKTLCFVFEIYENVLLLKKKRTFFCVTCTVMVVIYRYFLLLIRTALSHKMNTKPPRKKPFSGAAIFQINNYTVLFCCVKLKVEFF